MLNCMWYYLHTPPISASMDWISLLRSANCGVAIPKLFEALTLDFSSGLYMI